jgi:hypothetical protein
MNKFAKGTQKGQTLGSKRTTSGIYRKTKEPLAGLA